MGWARTLLLGDIGNRLDIEDAEEEIRTLRRRVRDKAHTDRSQDEQIKALTTEVEHLSLGVATLSRLLIARGVLSGEDIAEFGALLEEEQDG